MQFLSKIMLLSQFAPARLIGLLRLDNYYFIGNFHNLDLMLQTVFRITPALFYSVKQCVWNWTIYCTKLINNNYYKIINKNVLLHLNMQPTTINATFWNCKRCSKYPPPDIIKTCLKLRYKLLWTLSKILGCSCSSC